MEVFYKVWLIIASMTFILCLGVFIVSVFDTFQKNELPNIEDVQVGINT